ncbi:MAG: PilZ domain-containing protein [Candidatus Omnitrophica bacterium]|nr:PilZ domain-containing protein [Candidatus Omnitrophota bacterium]
MDTILLSRIIIAIQAAISGIIIFIFIKAVGKLKAKTEVKTPYREKVRKLEQEINLLQQELNKEKENSRTLQSKLAELEKVREEETRKLAAEKELTRHKEEELNRINREYEGLKARILKEEQEQKDALMVKEKELDKLNETIVSLNKVLQEKSDTILSLEQKIKENSAKVIDEEAEKQKRLEISREVKKRKIGEILLARNLITEETLEKALEYQNQTGCGLTQYLLHYGYIDESKLAECLCTQFAVPYLPLSSYEISEEIIKLVPVDIAQKYWLIPVDKQGDSLMLVMTDPLDNKAIKEIEEVTGLKVMPFVGIISEIAAALKTYYKIPVYTGVRDKKTPPFFVNTPTYSGIERRHSIRYDIKIGISFPVQGRYEKSHTINISRGGVAFESPADIDVGTLVTLEMNLPEEFSPLPIPVIVEVLRSNQLEKNKFEICAKIVKVSKQEFNAIIDYAIANSDNKMKVK